MSDPPDDGAADDGHESHSDSLANQNSSGSGDASAATSDPSPPTEPSQNVEERPSVAATAGIDEDVIDVPRELASTVRLQWVIRSALGALVLGVVAGAVAYGVGTATTYLAGTVQSAATVGVAVFALFAIVGVVRAVLLYRSWSYVVRADSLFLSRGVFTQVRTVVPYVRVQHIDTTRSPLERVLGLSTLVVYTAGSRGADVTIPGLTPERASTLQQRLERLTIESEEADAV